MKRYFTLLLSMLPILCTALTITDIRYGSFFEGKLANAQVKKTDHTRIILELDSNCEYSHLWQNEAIIVNLPIFKTQLNKVYLMEDGLVHHIFIDSTTVKIDMMGKYSTHKVSTLIDPFRIVIDVFGSSEKKEIVKVQKIEQNSTKISVLSRGKIQSINVEDLLEFFPSKERLFIDLYELPFDQILRYFSKQSTVSIVPDESVTGEISLSIKNQTLAQAFKILLDSKGYSYYKSNGTLIVTKTDISQMKEKKTIYSVYLNHIKSNEMERIINYYFPQESTVMINSISNLFEVSIPEIYTAKVDSIIDKYDRPAPKIECTISAGIINISELANLKLNKPINVINNSIAQNFKKYILYHQAVPINNDFQYKFFKEKEYKNGIFKTPSRIKSGFSLNFNMRFSRNKLFDIAIKSDIATIDLEKTQTNISSFDRLDLEFNESIIIICSVNSEEFDDFLSNEIIYYNSKDFIQYILITPKISGK